MIAAIDAVRAHRLGPGIHMKSALKAGAAPEQVFETMLVAALPAGIHEPTTSREAFQEVTGDYHAKYPDLSDWLGGVTAPPTSN